MDGDHGTPTPGTARDGSEDDRYVLRSRDAAELRRLEHQHQVWREPTERVLSRAGFGPGDRLLDVGCGPGFLSLELARRVGEAGSVVALDRSTRFVEHLHERAREEGLSWIDPRLGDARALDLPAGSFDGAICRWVLMFLDRPEAVVEGLVRSLAPGGVVAILEYVDFRAISLWPRARPFSRIYEAVHELLVRAGGDPDVGGRVPALLEAAGCEVVALEPFLRVGRPGSPLWEWLDAVNANHGNLVEAGLVTPEELDAYHRSWAEAAETPGVFLAAPPLLGTVARKRT